MERLSNTLEVSSSSFKSRAVPLICAWCKRIVGIIKSDRNDEMRTFPTHGICPECFKRTMTELAPGALNDIS
jgi:hypothetical protein